MRDAIHALKYQALLPAARPLGRFLAGAITHLAGDLPAGALVIPVPLHRSKFSQRGFNQARLLAGHAVSVLRKTRPAWRLELVAGAVVRLKGTESQAGLTPRQRRQNVRAAFVVPDPQIIAGRNVVVVDDILTTGATVRSVARALLRAGAANVWVATLSRAQLGSDHAGNPAQVYSEKGLVERPRTRGEHSAIGREMEDNQPSF
jgi:ComF family protein